MRLHGKMVPGRRYWNNANEQGLAHVSLVIIRYNILASIKRTLDYDTIGGLFGDMYLGVHELTVVEKIWAIIIEVVAVVSELIGADSDELTIQIIENDKRLVALREYLKRLEF